MPFPIAKAAKISNGTGKNSGEVEKTRVFLELALNSSRRYAYMTLVLRLDRLQRG
jgi:hypothetical protein